METLLVKVQTFINHSDSTFGVCLNKYNVVALQNEPYDGYIVFEQQQ